MGEKFFKWLILLIGGIETEENYGELWERLYQKLWHRAGRGRGVGHPGVGKDRHTLESSAGHLKRGGNSP